jgi:hypothetical protein
LFFRVTYACVLYYAPNSIERNNFLNIFYFRREMELYRLRFPHSFLSARAPPAAAKTPNPPIGAWLGVEGKVGCAIIVDMGMINANHFP